MVMPQRKYQIQTINTAKEIAHITSSPGKTEWDIEYCNSNRKYHVINTA